MRANSFLRVALLGLVAVAGTSCTAIPDSPIVSNGPAAPAGSLVGLHQPVWAGRVVATPMEVHEDSRCPENARCVWAGRVVVLTRIDGAGWRESAYLTPGEPHATHGTTITLTSVQPERQADSQIEPAAYRFGYEGGS